MKEIKGIFYFPGDCLNHLEGKSGGSVILE